MSRDTFKRWELLIQGDSDKGKELRAMYDEIKRGGYQCYLCAKVIHRNGKFYLLPQPVEYIHRQECECDKFGIRLTLMCPKCGDKLLELTQSLRQSPFAKGEANGIHSR